MGLTDNVTASNGCQAAQRGNRRCPACAGKEVTDTMFDWTVDNGYVIIKLLGFEVGCGRGCRHRFAAHIGFFDLILSTE